jgi:prolyl-tRNA editing enzyme YbaK/EbsC (Cys-tRNA(Pro) deacylase)
LVSGANRVDLPRLEAYLGEQLEKPDAEYVRWVTGFAIGGVPPIGHTQPLEALIDPDLLEYERIYAAAGTPFALFGLSPQELLQLTGGRVLAPSEVGAKPSLPPQRCPRGGGWWKTSPLGSGYSLR